MNKFLFTTIVALISTFFIFAFLKIQQNSKQFSMFPPRANVTAGNDQFGQIYASGIKRAEEKCGSKGGILSIGSSKERNKMVDETIYLVTCANGEQMAFMVKW